MEAIQKVAKKSKVSASLSASTLAAVAASAATGTYVKRLEEYAKEEAAIIGKGMSSRAELWLEIFKAYGTTDMPALEGYPKMVRHAFAQEMGLDMSISRKDWKEDQKRLYASFCANQTQPFNLLLELAQKGGTPRVIMLLEAKGTLPTKIKAVKELLGKPVVTRGANQARNDDAGDTDETETETSTTTSNRGGNQWDITDLKKKSPADACLTLIATMGYADCVRIVQGVAKRLKQSEDGLDKLAAERFESAVNEYLIKAAS